MTNTLYYGDNLHVLREHVKDESVDLIYLDPPFNSNANYNILFKGPGGDSSESQIEAFEDTWHWNESAESAFDGVMRSGNTAAFTLLRAMRDFLGDNDMMAYLAMMAVRLIELHRVLKPTGSLYLHCDPTASHYLKIMLDAIFGPERFRSEVVWKRSSAHSSAKRWSPVHDVIFMYTKGDKYTWNPVYQPLPQETADAWYNNVEEGTGRRFNRADLTAAGTRTGPSGQPWRGVDPTTKGRHWAIPGFVKDVVAGLDTQAALDALDVAGRIFWPKKKGGSPMLKRYLDEAKGIPALDVITDISPLNNVSIERLGYPTQKPEALLHRIIYASSNEGDVVLDPFCGCGTTVAAAQQMRRQWIGIDITFIAVDLIDKRLRDTYGSEVRATYEVHGIPRDVGGAGALFRANPFDFERWAVSVVGGQPHQRAEQAGDKGVDGWIRFPVSDRDIGRVIVSVKGGRQLNPAMVRDLHGTVESQRADMGLLVTLGEPTRGMREEARRSGTYTHPLTRHSYPRLQVSTVDELLRGRQPDLPSAFLPYVKARAATVGQQGSFGI